MFGRQAKVFIDLMLGPHLHQCQSQKYAAQLKERLEKAYQQVRQKKRINGLQFEKGKRLQ